jgi:hypothetical protein
LSRKAVHDWVEKFSQGRSEVADDETEMRKWFETTVQRLLCCGFRRTGKAMWQVSMSVEMSRTKRFFQVRMSHVSHFMSICDLFIDPRSQYWLKKNWKHPSKLPLMIINNLMFPLLPPDFYISGWWVVSFTPRSRYSQGKTPWFHWIGGWVDPRGGLDDTEKWKFLPPPVVEV